MLYLPFNEGAGAIAYDASPYGNDGALVNGASWVNGYRDKAAYLNGTNQYVNIIYSPSLYPQSITICAWVKLESHTQNYQIVRPAGGYSSYCLVVLTDLRVYLAYFNPTQTQYIEVISTSKITLGEWCFIYAGMVPAGQSGAKIFIGINDKYEEFPAWQSRYIPTSESLFIGYWMGEYAKGAIDEVRIYNRALTKEELCFLAGLPYVPEPPSLGTINVSSLWSYLYVGNFVGFMYAVLATAFTTQTIGIAVICLIGFTAIYLRTRSLMLMIVLWMLVGSALIMLMPEASLLAFLFIALGITGTIYRLFRPTYG